MYPKVGDEWVICLSAARTYAEPRSRSDVRVDLEAIALGPRVPVKILAHDDRLRAVAEGAAASGVLAVERPPEASVRVLENLLEDLSGR